MTVENGNGLENANSYVSIEYADEYFTSHGFSAWSKLEESEKEVALVKASDYVDNVFDWNGIKASKEQAMNFPRTNLFDKNGYEVSGIPKQLKDAVCEACSLIATDTELYLAASENGAVTSENIGGKLSFTYDVSSKVKDSSLYESINYRLRGLYRETSKAKVLSGKIKRKL